MLELGVKELLFILKMIQTAVQYGSPEGQMKDCFFFFWV